MGQDLGKNQDARDERMGQRSNPMFDQHLGSDDDRLSTFVGMIPERSRGGVEPHPDSNIRWVSGVEPQISDV